MSERGPHSESSIEASHRDPVNAFFVVLKKRGITMDTIAPAQVDFSYLTPEQRAETYWALYQEAKGLTRRNTGEKEESAEEVQECADRATPVLALLKTLHEDKETQTVFRSEYDRHRYEMNTLNGNREQYKALRAEIRRLEETYDTSACDLFAHRTRGIAESRIIIFEVTTRQLAAKRTELAQLLEYNPNLGAHAMSETLKGYAKELQSEHFIWSPSRRDYLEDIEATALGGKPLLVSGESGTGKTRLVEQAALVLTGKPNAQTPGKDVRFQDLIAKPKIAPDGSTYYVFQEIGEAFTGKESTHDAVPKHQGLLVADDEFNLLDEAEQNTRLSRVSSWTPGKNVRMPVTNTSETIAPRALYVAEWKKIVQEYITQQSDYRGPVRMDEGDRLEDPIAAKIDIASGEYNPTGFEKIVSVEKVQADFGGINIYFSFDLSGSMAESDPASGRQKADVQRDAGLLFVDSLMQCAFVARQMESQDVSLPVKIMVTVASERGRVQLPLTDRWTPKEQWAFYTALAQTAKGGTPIHEALAHIERAYDAEAAALTKKKVPKEKQPIHYTVELTDGAPNDVGAVRAAHERLQRKGMAVRAYVVGEDPPENYGASAEPVASFSAVPALLAKDIVEVFQKLKPTRVKRS